MKEEPAASQGFGMLGGAGSGASGRVVFPHVLAMVTKMLPIII